MNPVDLAIELRNALESVGELTLKLAKTEAILKEGIENRNRLDQQVTDLRATLDGNVRDHESQVDLARQEKKAAENALVLYVAKKNERVVEEVSRLLEKREKILAIKAMRVAAERETDTVGLLRPSKHLVDHWDEHFPSLPERTREEPSSKKEEGETDNRAEVWHTKDFSLFPSRIPFPSGHQKVALVDSDDLEKIFKLTNGTDAHPWSENEGVECLVDSPRSTSAGDVVVLNGIVHRCLTMGWEKEDILF